MWPFYYQLRTNSKGQQRIERRDKKGAKKHEIYAAVCGGHLFVDYFAGTWGGGVLSNCRFESALWY